MPAPARLEHREHLQPDLRERVRAFVAEVAAARGAAPLGERKQSQLDAAADTEADRDHHGDRDGDHDRWSGVLAYDASGGLVGYAHLRWSAPGTQPKAAVELAHHQDAEAVGHGLLDAAERAVAGAGGGDLWVWIHEVSDPAATLPAARGYRVQRRLAFLRRPLPEPPEPPPAPPGVSLRPYRGPGDDAEFLRVNNAAFEGHPENGAWTPEVFEARRHLPWFDPRDLLLAWAGKTLTGFHWTKRAGEVGEVYVLAVDPARQGSGLGRYLLEAGLAHLHDRGCREVVLYVDRASSSAVRLYEAAGFASVHDEVCFERRVEDA